VFKRSCVQILRGVLFAVVSGALTAGCLVKVSRPAEQVVSIYISGNLDLGKLPEAVTIVRSGRKSKPCLWLVYGNVLSDRLATAFADGVAQVRLLNAVGVDAIVLGPEWLELGLEQCRQLIDEGQFYFLGANLVDSLGEPLGHPFMLKRFGSEVLGLTGIWLDSTDTRLYLSGMDFVPADFAIRKTLPLVRQRARILGVMARPDGNVPDSGLDFVVGEDQEDMITLSPADEGNRIARFDLVMQDGRIMDYATKVEELDAVEPDSMTLAVLDSIQAVFDSVGSALITNAEVRMSTETLNRVLIRGYLGKGVDGFIDDVSLLTDALGPGPVTNKKLVNVLRNPGRRVLVTLSGSAIKSLLTDSSVKLEWRRGKKMTPEGQYRLATSLDFIKRHPKPVFKRYELDRKQFWMICADILASAEEKL